MTGFVEQLKRQVGLVVQSEKPRHTASDNDGALHGNILYDGPEFLFRDGHCHDPKPAGELRDG